MFAIIVMVGVMFLIMTLGVAIYKEDPEEGIVFNFISILLCLALALFGGCGIPKSNETATIINQTLTNNTLYVTYSHPVGATLKEGVLKSDKAAHVLAHPSNIVVNVSIGSSRFSENDIIHSAFTIGIKNQKEK